MTIEVTNIKAHIASARLDTDNFATLWARAGHQYSRGEDRPVFYVGPERDEEAQYFDAPACREAAEFFTKLAEDLEDRS